MVNVDYSLNNKYIIANVKSINILTCVAIINMQ